MPHVHYLCSPSQQSQEIGAVIVPSLQREELRHRARIPTQSASSIPDNYKIPTEIGRRCKTQCCLKHKLGSDVYFVIELKTGVDKCTELKCQHLGVYR